MKNSPLALCLAINSDMFMAVAKLILWTFNFVLSSVSAFFIVFTLKRCKQCPFFGEIQEVQRVYTGGSTWWCLFSLAASVTSMFTSLIVVQRHISIMLDSISTSRYLLLLKSSLIWTFLAALITSIGFRVWCTSFKVNSCENNSSQDWHAFKPKYSDCFGLFAWQVIVTQCLWVSFLCQWFHYQFLCTNRNVSRK